MKLVQGGHSIMSEIVRDYSNVPEVQEAIHNPDWDFTDMFPPEIKRQSGVYIEREKKKLALRQNVPYADDEIKRMYTVDGMYSREIAECFGVKRTSIEWRLKKLGLTYKDRGER